MLEYMGRIEEGLPALDARAYAWPGGPRFAGVVYLHPLKIQLMADDGTMTESNALLSRAQELGWVSTANFAGWAAPCPGWHAELTDDHLLLRQPDGAAWYDGTLPTCEAWRAAARKSGQIYHFTADCGDLDAVGEMIASGQALAVVSGCDISSG
ncbi:hypothetical protein [Streptomyces chattanoogensis]|uniref:hypothetical protein n=1 Tax=Streptomyces chattanoogensis TaxID=66876 RepID=UPI0036BE9FB8